MKKLVVFLLILSCLCSTIFVKFWKNPIYDMSGVERACLICDEKFDDMDVVECGETFFNYCTYSQALEKINGNSVKGFQLYFNNKSPEWLFEVLSVEVIKKEEIEDIVIYTGFTPYWQTYVFVEEKKANIQIAVKNGNIVTGFPAILTGY